MKELCRHCEYGYIPCDAPQTEDHFECHFLDMVEDPYNEIKPCDAYNVNGWLFRKDYELTDNCILMADLEDIVQLMCKQDNVEWVKDRSDMKLAFWTIFHEIADRLHELEERK